MLRLAEGITDILLEFYREHLPAKVAELNASHSGPVRLKAPQMGAYHAGELKLVDNIDYPKVFVLPQSTTLRGVYGPDWVDATHEVQIVVAVKGDNLEVLRRQLYRYVVALWELLVQDFFGRARDDYATEGETTITYELDNPLQTTQPYIGRAILNVPFTKQEFG